MKERPILFSAPMVRAILDGRKTQTRRIVKPGRDPYVGCQMAPCEIAGDINNGNFAIAPYGQPGDRLWVRETWAPCGRNSAGVGPDFLYRADLAPGSYYPAVERWKPSIHMPRRASRITLEITAVRVERLQGISEADAKAEGADPYRLPVHPNREQIRHVDGYQAIWESINGPHSWDKNPWVWVLEFKRV